MEQDKTAKYDNSYNNYKQKNKKKRVNGNEGKWNSKKQYSNYPQEPENVFSHFKQQVDHYEGGNNNYENPNLGMVPQPPFDFLASFHPMMPSHLFPMFPQGSDLNMAPLVSGGFDFPQNFEQAPAQQEYWPEEEQLEMSDFDIKMNEYILHIRPEKLLVYENHLFNVMQPKKTQIDVNLENLPFNIHYSDIIEFLEFNGVHTIAKQIYVKVRGYNKDKATIN